MNGIASTSFGGGESIGRRSLFAVLLTCGVLATVGVTVVTNGNVLAAVAPVLGLTVLIAIWVAPLRVTLMAMVFFGLALDASGDGPWDSPVAPLGRLLLHNLNKTVPISALTLPASALLLTYLGVIHVHRVLSASSADRGRAIPARPLAWGLALSLLTVVVLVATGARRGGDMQMAKNQAQNFLLTLFTAYLFAVSLRAKDYRTLGRLVIAAACVKSLMALWVYNTVVPTPAVATTHGDSLLFTIAAIILLVQFAESPTRRHAFVCVLVLPLILGGVIANNRRLAWVEMALAAGTFWLMARRTDLKRSIARGAVVALPLVLVYVGAGWNSDAGFFAPVKTLRSMGDADVDRSTLFRDIENFNLVFTMTTNPVGGAGLGTPYTEVIKGDDISFFKEYRFMPHNSVLGIWAYGGIIGSSGIWMCLIIGTFLAARAYRFARSTEERIAALSVLSMIVAYEIQCWGDIGFSEARAFLLVGPALAIAGQLALSTGAWTEGRSSLEIAKARA